MTAATIAAHIASQPHADINLDDIGPWTPDTHGDLIYLPGHLTPTQAANIAAEWDGLEIHTRTPGFAPEHLWYTADGHAPGCGCPANDWDCPVTSVHGPIPGLNDTVYLRPAHTDTPNAMPVTVAYIR